MNKIAEADLAPAIFVLGVKKLFICDITVKCLENLCTLLTNTGVIVIIYYLNVITGIKKYFWEEIK